MNSMCVRARMCVSIHVRVYIWAYVKPSCRSRATQGYVAICYAATCVLVRSCVSKHVEKESIDTQRVCQGVVTPYPWDTQYQLSSKAQLSMDFKFVKFVSHYMSPWTLSFYSMDCEFLSHYIQLTPCHHPAPSLDPLTHSLCLLHSCDPLLALPFALLLFFLP